MNPLEQLKDIHLSVGISQWPPAIGWWLLLLLSCGLILMTTIWLVRRYRRRLALRQALKELANLSSNNQWPQALNQLLKRAAISYFPRAQVASLHQQQWLDFLCRQLPKNKQEQFMQPFSLLIEHLYSPHSESLKLEEYKALAATWLKQALPPGKKQREVADV